MSGKNWAYTNLTIVLGFMFLSGVGGHTVLAQSQTETATRKLELLSESPDSLNNIAQLRALIQAGALRIGARGLTALSGEPRRRRAEDGSQPSG